MKLGGFIVAGLVVSVCLAVFGAPFASSSPDGLEKVTSEGLSLNKPEAAPAWPYAPVNDYTMPGVPSARVSTALAGLIGTLTTFVAAWSLAKWAGRRKGQP